MSDKGQRIAFFESLRRWFGGAGGAEIPVNFSPRAQQILSLARKAATDRGHPEILPDHILLGMLQLNRGVAVNVLRRVGCNLPKLQAAAAAGVHRHRISPRPVSPRYSTESKSLLAAAVREARNLGHFHVGTEHLLLGLLTVRVGEGRRLLEAFGLDAETIRIGVLRELDPNLDPNETADGSVSQA